jgi:hypothetical protein
MMPFDEFNITCYDTTLFFPKYLILHLHIVNKQLKKKKRTHNVMEFGYNKAMSQDPQSLTVKYVESLEQMSLITVNLDFLHQANGYSSAN